MSGEENTKDAELWEALQGLDDDLLRPDSPIEDVDNVLREAGADPDQVARRGAAFVAKLAKSRRLSWRERARRRLTELAAKASRQPRSDLAGTELRVAIDRARTHPALEGHLAAAFRSRNDEDLSDDERRDLLADIEAVISMAEAEEEGVDEEHE